MAVLRMIMEKYLQLGPCPVGDRFVFLFINSIVLHRDHRGFSQRGMDAKPESSAGN